MLPLTLKYRPQDFDQIEGQALTVEVLKGASRSGRLAQAYLLTGPRGTGKTSAARIIAKAINCLQLREDGNPCGTCAICSQVLDGSLLDLIEIDAASHTGVDHVRELIDRARFLPSVAKKKVYIVDEVHMLSKGAFNALLKTLEEPPEHVHFILATTELDKVPGTIVSRCQTFRFLPISEEQVLTRLRTICEAEGMPYEEAALSVIVRHAGGGLRDALSLLEKAAHGAGLQEARVRSLLGEASDEAFRRLETVILSGDAAAALAVVRETGSTLENPAGLERSWIRFLRDRVREEIVAKGNPSVPLGLLTTSQQALTLFAGCDIPALGMEVAVLRCMLPSEPVHSTAGQAPTAAPAEAGPRAPLAPLSPVSEHDAGGDRPVPAPSPKPPANSPAAAISPAPTERRDFVAHWDAFAATLPSALKHPIASSTPVVDEQGRLIVQVSSKMYAERLLDRVHLVLVQDALRAYFGQDVQVSIRHVPSSRGGDGSTPAGSIDDALQVFS